MLGIVLELGNDSINRFEKLFALVTSFAYFGEEIAKLSVAKLDRCPFGLDRLQ